MMVTHMWSGGELWKVTGQGYEPNGSFMKGEKKLIQLRRNHFINYLHLVRYVITQILFKKKKAYVLDGDPTEGACSCSNEKGITREALKGNLKLFVNFRLIQLEK